MINPPAEVMARHAIETLTAQNKLFASFNTEAEARPNTLKMGVYVDGKLRLQSRDLEAIHAFAEKQMNERHEVWVTPVGSFVDDRRKK